MPKLAFTTVRIHISTRKRLRKLVDEIMRSGWNAIGADRADVPGVGTVIDQALALLEAKLGTKEKE